MKYSDQTNYDLLAKIHLTPKGFGGRNKPVYNGYRGQFFWHINDVACKDWDAVYVFLDEPFGPGETTFVKVWISESLKTASRGDFPIGRQFCIREGINVVGTAVILENRLSNDV